MDDPRGPGRPASFWNRVHRGRTLPGPAAHWWDRPAVHRHLKSLVLEGPSPDGESLAAALLRERFGGRLPFARALSVGAGHATEEIAMLAAGEVAHFELWDFSAAAAGEGRRAARAAGVADGRLDYRVGDGFAALDRPAGPYDLVFWRHSLHHMPDTRKALEWTRRRLAEGGVALVYEYVGPNRLQWTPAMLRAVNAFRAQMPQAYFRRPPHARAWITLLRRLRLAALGRWFPAAWRARIGRTLAREFPRRVAPADPLGLMRLDPTEAIDAENILPALREIFPGARVKALGGALFHPGLEGIVANMPDGDPWLARMLEEDWRLCREEGLCHYAVAWAVRS